MFLPVIVNASFCAGITLCSAGRKQYRLRNVPYDEVRRIFPPEKPA